MNKLVTLDELIKKVCPIHGVDSTGKISFKDEATEEQRTEASRIVSDFNWEAPDPEETKRTEMRALIDSIEDGSAKAGDLRKLVVFIARRYI